MTREDELLPVALTLAYQPPAAAGHWAESGLFQPNQMNMHFIGGAYFCIFISTPRTEARPEIHETRAFPGLIVEAGLYRRTNG